MQIGIDLGGTKIEVAVPGPDGSFHYRQRTPTPQGNYGATLQAIADLVAGAEQACGQAGTVGVATPGALSPATGRIKNANSTCLIGHPLDRDLAALLDRPVRLANDADCFALSEARDGAGAGAQSVFGIILGTGVGGGLVWRSDLISGPNAIAGEWGHNPLPWPRDDELPGPACYCGKTGCIEAFLSGPAMQRLHAVATGRDLPPAGIVDPAFRARHADRLARALAGVINIFDPEVIVFGGGLSNLDWLIPETERRLPAWVFSDTVRTRLATARHGDSSGVRGAAWLWPAKDAV